ncbi:MAG: alpha/beta fold hydrolase [Polyangiales bacterium]
MRYLLAFACLSLLGCSESTSYSVDPPRYVGKDRPARVVAPSDYDPKESYPLILLLHGYGATSGLQDVYFGFDRVQDKFGFVLLLPEGTENSEGKQFWNATEACCDFENTQVDDVAYLTELVRQTQKTYHIDPSRIYIVGHSNGGFMGLRMACDKPKSFAAIMSLAGSTYEDASECQPDGDIPSILLLHGTNDETIFYDGASFDSDAEVKGYPSAMTTAERFANLGDCNIASPISSDGEEFRIVGDLPGADTRVLRYEGCRQGFDLELWTIVDGTHIPIPLATDFADRIVTWLYAHPRP